MRRLHLAATVLSFFTLLILTTTTVAQTATTVAPKTCSLTNTNHDCTLTLDRNSFVFPATLQLYPGAVVTVGIQGGKDFELYTLDPAPGQATLLPDVTATALGNLNTILAAAGSLQAAAASPLPAQPAQAALPPPALPPPPPEKALSHKVDPCDKNPNGLECREEKNAELANAVTQALVAQRKKDMEKQSIADNNAKAAFNAYIAVCDPDHLSQFSSEDCMMQLLNDKSKLILEATYASEAFYRELNPLLTPDAQPLLVPPPPFSTYPAPHIPFSQLLLELCGQLTGPCGMKDDGSLIHQQAKASANAAAVLSRMTKAPTNISVPPSAIYPQLSPRVLNAMQLLTEEQAALDAVRKDLEGYATRLQDLVFRPTITAGTVGYIRDSGPRGHVSRTVNYTLNRLNLVSNSQEAANDGSKKVPIVTITVVYGESRWEASTGVALPFRPIRTFTVAPTVENGVQIGSYISESKASPEVAPFIAADYRLGPDFRLFGWRSAFYATGGIGYNTSQESADFLVGPSISWRGLLLSALCDFGHGARLAQGLTVGEQLGTATTPTTITTLPTTNYWVPAFTIGISVRIPGISGR